MYIYPGSQADYQKIIETPIWDDDKDSLRSCRLGKNPYLIFQWSTGGLPGYTSPPKTSQLGHPTWVVIHHQVLLVVALAESTRLAAVFFFGEFNDFCAAERGGSRKNFLDLRLLDAPGKGEPKIFSQMVVFHGDLLWYNP